MAEAMTMDVESHNEIEHLSKNLVTMFEKGKWDVKRVQRKSEIILLQSILNMTSSMGMVYGGSIAEGTDIEGSDHDYMLIVPGIHVVGNPEEKKELKGHVFLMREDGHRPCYPSLQLLSKDDSYHGLIKKLGGIEKFIHEVNDGTQYLSSEKFARALEDATIDIKISDKTIHRHGPCATFVVRKGSETHEYDTVCTIPSKAWPKEADEWINRPRSKGWPTPEVVQKVVQTGCTLVPLGNPFSEDRHIEWRISFLLGERELMWSLNNCQYYVFITLKYILKMHLDKLFPDKISTFHMKTILFWISEEQGLEYWREENIFQCIRDCLDRLLQYIKDTLMPHYFARGNNILTGKLDSVHERSEIASAVQFVISNLAEVVHRCFGCECPSDKCILHHGIKEGDLNFPTGSFSDYVMPHHSMNLLQPQLETHIRRRTLKELNAVRDGIKNLPEGITEEHKLLASDILDARCGVILQKYTTCFSATGMDLAQFDKMVSTAEAFLLKGCKIDAMAGKLQLATFYYMRGEIDKAKVWINSANNHEMLIAYTGRCSQNKTIRTIYNPNKKTPVDLNAPVKSETHACDVKYHPDDLQGLPKPLQYECALYNDLSDHQRIHPVVYSEALSVLVHIAQGENQYALDAVQHLAIAVENNEGQFYDIALNLLGYCYSLVGEEDQALHCFYLSYQKRRSVENPCLFHAIILLMNKAKDGAIAYQRAVYG
ncbi:hypothetical protein ACJMK2_033248 [Sinanodonta woodiana]|uniref:Mab-21-like nucleotidyltransferase domain-containing protein n=1 Tax=Sinanodonta woodiana TaxID=1069815 RepID=A0ABD3X822_SINWO